MKLQIFLVATVLLFIGLGCEVAQSANVLFYFGVSTYSHRIVVWNYVERLAALGHKVTFLSAFPPKSPNKNVTEFHPETLQEFMGKVFGTEANLIERRGEGNIGVMWKDLEDVGVEMCRVLMKDSEYLNFINSTRFDLVVIDTLHNECAYGIVHAHKSKFIIFGTSHQPMWFNDIYGFPTETSSIPDMALAYPTNMNFLQRVANSYETLLWYFRKEYRTYPKIEAAVNGGLRLVGAGNHQLRIRELEQNVSLVMLNSHFSIDYARALPPLFVLVGGLHLTAPSKSRVPKNIQKFMDESGDQGFVYVSFGSAVRISKASQDIRRAFLGAFGNSSTRFVWKWEGPVPAEMPLNVVTAEWMPQAEILAHPKIRGFITHGGLLGAEEALANEVPLIMVPIFAEQDYNADRMESVGYGIKIEIIGVTQEKLQGALQELLTNPSYKLKAQEVSRRFRDRQNDPLDTAVWWTEYVLRHPHTPLLISKGREQSWLIRRSLDVYGSVIGAFALLVGVLVGCAFNRKGHKLKRD